jgi:hypothetical protein
MTHLASARFRIALLALIGGAGLFGAAAISALRVPPLPSRYDVNAIAPIGALNRPAATDADAIEQAVANDPFQSTGEAPATRYGSAAIPVTVQDAAGGNGRQSASIRLLGTVIDRDGASFALCQLEGTTVKMVHAGQQIGQYKLRSITPGGAVFEGEDGAHLELKVSRSSN